MGKWLPATAVHWWLLTAFLAGPSHSRMLRPTRLLLVFEKGAFYGSDTGIRAAVMNPEVARELRLLLSRVILTSLTDTQEEALFTRINDLSPDPEWLNYIFHTNEFFDLHGALDLDRLIAQIASYRPITL